MAGRGGRRGTRSLAELRELWGPCQREGGGSLARWGRGQLLLARAGRGAGEVPEETVSPWVRRERGWGLVAQPVDCLTEVTVHRCSASAQQGTALG